MTEDERKKQWKADAKQLKADLASRPKDIKKREVPLSFGKSGKGKPASNPKKSDLSTPDQDAGMRNMLGL